MAKDPEKARKRAREEFAQINIRIRAQEALVEKLRKGRVDQVVEWHDATLQHKTLKKKRQEIIKRMG